MDGRSEVSSITNLSPVNLIEVENLESLECLVKSSATSCNSDDY
jgi:hypothetical protein